MTLSHVQISEKLAFDAITFEFEIDLKLMTTKLAADNTTRYSEANRKTLCGPVPGRCLIMKALYGDNDFQYDPPAQVQALGVCLNDAGGEELRSDYIEGTSIVRFQCDQNSNTSMLVFSVGKRVTADDLFVSNTSSISPPFSTGNDPFAVNVRKYFTFTIGRLSWEWSNLSKDFGATCNDKNSCLGLHLPLSNTTDSTKQALVAGANTLSVSTLSPPRASLSSAQRLLPLALVRESPLRLSYSTSRSRDYAAGDLLLPHNIKLGNWSDRTDIGEGYTCDASIEDRVNSTLNNHLYNEHGLQPAYTAAVFFLFENAVVRDVIPLGTDGATTLDFAQNIHDVAVWLSVPEQSVWLTGAGCILLAVGLAAAMLHSVSLSKTNSDTLAKITEPHVIARVMLDEAKFPPLLLHRRIVSSDDSQVGEMRYRKVDQFAIDSLVLQHERDQDRLTAVV